MKTKVEDNIEIIPKKRGRKPKKEVIESSDNIIVMIEENLDTNKQNIKINIDEPNSLSSNEDELENTYLTFNSVNETISTKEEPKPGMKKRGRKPKGGKIIQQIVPTISSKESKPNIILHLRCSLKDLNKNTHLNSSIEGFDFPSKNNYTYEIVENNYETSNVYEKEKINVQNIFAECKQDINEYDEIKESKENDIKEIWKKLKNLQHNLHINNINDKKSACFWCTYEFDNPPIYIPKYYIKESYHVYGCFCSPECATAYLMDENIDSSSKFERYHLINHIYAKIYNYNKNIKPAPNPYFMLEKYYGNLNIQEYRSLFKNERLFLVVDKPLTRILPELHEDNDDFIINNKIIPSNNYNINKKMQRKNVTKNNIMNEKFGLLQQ